MPIMMLAGKGFEDCLDYVYTRGGAHDKSCVGSSVSSWFVHLKQGANHCKHLIAISIGKRSGPDVRSAGVRRTDELAPGDAVDWKY
jgi:hypothetical protein